MDEDDEKPTPRRGPTRKDPSFRFKAEWPKFYADHQEDLDALWDKAVAYAFNTPGLREALDDVEPVAEEEEVGEI